MKNSGKLLVGTLAMTMVLASGCGQADSAKNQGAVPPATVTDQAQKEAIKNEVATKNSDIFAATMIKYTALIGQNDKALVAAMGEGIPSYLEGTKEILGREYTLTIGEDSYAVGAHFSDDKMVQELNISLSKGTFADWNKRLTESFGQASAETKSKENDGQSMTWQVEGKSVVLQEAYRSLFITVGAVQSK